MKATGWVAGVSRSLTVRRPCSNKRQLQGTELIGTGLAMSDKTFDPVRVSKFMALVLRHNPEAVGLTLDAEGWTPVPDLLRALKEQGFLLSRFDLERIVAEDSKGRYALSADKRLIRANQGHSVEGVRLAFQQAEPPDTLYHGTVANFIEPIFREGLRKMRRHHVHLSPDIETASKVGGRRGNPIILAVDAKAMRENGHVFFLSDNGVWLTEAVPPHYLTII